ncbi:MAG: serine/threonine protein kinase [Lachnospiraceae bacterium]|nr:serine/threonine protein kinase [Lachnospiraceae bacterium]
MQQTRCINCMKEIAPDVRTCPHCGYDQQAEQVSYAIRPNTILHGRYLVGRLIGKGGFGITYVGFDLMLEVKVAIKEYYPSGIASRNNSWSNQVVWESQSNGCQVQDARVRRQESMEHVLKEARRTAKLAEVPTVVRVNEVFQENETAYIIMDFIEGVTLKDYLIQNGAMSWEDCRKLLFPVMDALAKAHDLGIVHRDISPDNIMIEPDGTVRLLDLGAAVDINANNGHASMMVVKSNFSAMEQYDENGKIGSWTDVYAFAATLYYCLTGKLMMPVLDRIRNPEITFPNERKIPEQVKAALRKALVIYEDGRIQDMRAFKRELLRESNASKPEGWSQNLNQTEPLWANGQGGTENNPQNTGNYGSNRTSGQNGMGSETQGTRADNFENCGPNFVVVHSVVDQKTMYDFLVRNGQLNFASAYMIFMGIFCFCSLLDTNENQHFEFFILAALSLYCLVFPVVMRLILRGRARKMTEKGGKPTNYATFVLTPERIELTQNGEHVCFVNWSDITKVITTKYAVVLYKKENQGKRSGVKRLNAHILTKEGIGAQMEYLCALIRRYAYNAKPVKLKN